MGVSFTFANNNFERKQVVNAQEKTTIGILMMRLFNFKRLAYEVYNGQYNS